MKKFRHFITEGIRQGLPHITTMDHEQFHNLIHKGKVHLNKVTEKTDGSTFQMGHDKQGFYTQSSGSGNERMRSSEDYHNRAKRRAAETGKPLDLTAAKAFGHAHDVLHKNEKFQSYMKSKAEKHGGETSLKGELFYKPLARKSEEHPDELKFVGTSYHPGHMGKVGKVVVHTQLADNKHHDVHAIKAASDEHINFDDDITDVKKGHVDVSDHHSEFKKLNHDLIKSRTTPTNKAAKLAEVEKMRGIQQKVSDKVDSHIQKLGIKPKWGKGTPEGVVVHPPEEGHTQPRFKVTSDAFRQFKKSGVDFKKRD